jgi:tetratricopeptide (TPR) repeat protein
MRVRLGCVAALSLPLLFVCPVGAQTAFPTAADISAAYQLYKTGHLPDALAKYKAILASNPSSDLQQQALFWQGIVQESTGQNDDATASFETLASVSPDYRWPEVLNKLALKYRAKGDSVKEKYFFDQLQQRRTTSDVHADKARADLLIGDYYKQAGDWSKAYQQFQSIQASYPEHAQDILFQIAYTAHSAGKYTEAITAGQAYVKQYPDSPQFEEVAFRVVEDLGYADRYKEALDYLDALAVSYPKLTTRAQVAKAEVLAEGIKDPQASMKAAQQVIDENKDPYQVYLAKYRIAFTLQNQLQQPLKARAILAEILPLYPKDNLAVEIASDIASTYSVGGDYLKAVSLYKDALANYPCPVPEWDAWIRYAIGRQYVLAKDRTSARKAWDDLAALHPGNDWLQVAQKEMATWPQ